MALTRVLAWAKSVTCTVTLGVTSLVALSAPGKAQPPAEEPSKAIQELRRSFMNESINALTFHSMDSIFHTAAVPKSETSTNLPRDERILDFDYSYSGTHFTPQEFLERNFTNALLIMKDGRVVYETYRNFTGPDTRFLSMSTAKSITSILVGAALEDGHIASLDDKVETYVPELRGSAFERATIKDLLLMKSGVDRADNYMPEPGSESANLREEIMVFNRRRSVDEAFTVKRVDAPGETFRYSTLNTNVLGWLIEKAVGKPINAYMSERLWRPLGAEADAFFITDGPAGVGRPTNGMGFNAVLRDYARVGLMMLNQGRVDNRQIISAKWVRESTVPTGPEPASPDDDQGYQYQWWTLVDSNAYMAIGLQGQFIFVDPDTRTVIVKLSYFPLRNSNEFYRESEAFFRAASAWTPK